MGSRLSILAGLLAGLLVAGALLLGFVFVGPDPTHPSPSPAASSISPAPSVTPNPAASIGASESPGASGSAAPGSSGSSAMTENFHVDVNGIVRDGALGGIGADVMVRGVQSILPGVVVTP